MKNYRKSVVFPLLLFVYTTVLAAWFLPHNTEVSSSEKWIRVVISYLIIILLWWILRKKEKVSASHKAESDKSDRGLKGSGE